MANDIVVYSKSGIKADVLYAALIDLAKANLGVYDGSWDEF